MQTAKKIDELMDMDIPEDLPYVFLLIPFEPKMNTKTGFESVVNAAADKTEKELMKKHPGDKVELVINKLHRVIQYLDYNVHKKSIAITVSPLIEKVYYFDYTPQMQWNSYEIASPLS